MTTHLQLFALTLAGGLMLSGATMASPFSDSCAAIEAKSMASLTSSDTGSSSLNGQSSADPAAMEFWDSSTPEVTLADCMAGEAAWLRG